MVALQKGEREGGLRTLRSTTTHTKEDLSYFNPTAKNTHTPFQKRKKTRKEFRRMSSHNEDDDGATKSGGGRRYVE